MSDACPILAVPTGRCQSTPALREGSDLEFVDDPAVDTECSCIAARFGKESILFGCVLGCIEGGEPTPESNDLAECQGDLRPDECVSE